MEALVDVRTATHCDNCFNVQYPALPGSPSKPCWQVQTQLPSVLVQSVLAPQLCPPSVHSFLSLQPEQDTLYDTKNKVLTIVDPMADIACLAEADEAVDVIVAIGAGGVVAAVLCAVKQHLTIATRVTPAHLVLWRSKVGSKRTSKEGRIVFFLDTSILQ